MAAGEFARPRSQRGAAGEFRDAFDGWDRLARVLRADGVPANLGRV